MTNTTPETPEQARERIIRESAERVLAAQRARREARRAHAHTTPKTAQQIRAEWSAQPGAIYSGRRILTDSERRAFAQEAQDEEDGIVRR